MSDDPLDGYTFDWRARAHTTSSPYEKNGHMVVDTGKLDESGHVPTHRLDQPTNRLAAESWPDYEDRVLARTAFSPDTARVSGLGALDHDVADSTRSLLRAAGLAGVHLSPTETGRSQERQEMLFQKGRSAPGDVATWTLTSDHTPGRAVDFSGDASAFDWLQKNASAHGFSVMGAIDPGHASMPQAPPPLTPSRAAGAQASEDPLAGYRPDWRSAPSLRTNHGASGTWGDAPELAPRGTINDLSRSVFQGATLGAGSKIAAAGNALIDRIQGVPFGDAYKDRLAAERGASADFAQKHPAVNFGAELAGGIGSMIASGGASAPSEIANLSKLARVGHAAATGADLGAVSGAINADGDLAERARGAIKGSAIAAAGGAVLSPIFEGVGTLASKAHLPELVSGAASKLSDLLPQGRIRDAVENIAASTGGRGQAASELAKRYEMDKAGGALPPAPTSNVPTMGVDQGGPNVEGLAKGIVRRPNTGGAKIRTALVERQAQMRPQVNQEFDLATGTTPKEGEALLAKLADEDARLTADAQTAKLAGRAKPTQPSPVDTWRDVQGESPNGVRELQRMVGEQKEEGNRLYGIAKDETRGQSVESETLDAIKETPIGKLALAWARTQKSNLGEALPTKPGAPVVPEGMDAESWAHAQALAKSRGMSVPDFGNGDDVELPDPETLHLMKRYFAQTARLGVRDGSEGKLAAEAQGALRQWDKIRDELPDVWRQADDAYARHARLINMLNEGRNVMRAQLNPPGKGALTRSLDALEQRVAQATPEEADAFRVGGRSAVNDYLKSGGSPAAIVKQASDPTSLMSRRLALATGDQDAAAKFAAKMLPTTPPVPDVEADPAMNAARRGLDVLKHRTSSSNPERTLSNLVEARGAMGDEEAAGLQQGAAQALRGKFASAAKNLESPGRVFAHGPERAEQASFAFPDQSSESRFQNLVKDWDALAGRKQRILGGSDTQANAAEQEARVKGGSAGYYLTRGHPITALRALVGGAGEEANTAQRRALDMSLAEMLTSQDPFIMRNATTSSLTRAQAAALRNKAAALAAAQAGARRR